MENLNVQNEEQALTGEKLDKMINTLLQIDEMDDRPLYYKIRSEIAVRKAARRRKLLWIRSCTAGVAAMLACAVLLLSENNKPAAEQLVEEKGVKLIVSDGRRYNLSTPDSFITDGNAVMTIGENTLLIDASGKDAEPAALTYNQLEVPRGQRYDLTLSDGTRVWLNSDSRLRFPSAFTDGERRVFIEGEAYFEVAHDPDKPFVVALGTQSLTVLGTSFNINAYEYNPAIQATLFSGSVKVNSTASGKEQLLVPGQQALLDRATGTIQVKEADLDDVMVWRKNIISLEKRTLEEVTNYMAKIYDVDFRFRDENARNIRLRGHVTRSDDILSVLARIGEAGQVRFSKNGNIIEIYME